MTVNPTPSATSVTARVTVYASDAAGLLALAELIATSFAGPDGSVESVTLEPASTSQAVRDGAGAEVALLWGATATIVVWAPMPYLGDTQG